MRGRGGQWRLGGRDRRGGHAPGFLSGHQRRVRAGGTTATWPLVVHALLPAPGPCPQSRRTTPGGRVADEAGGGIPMLLSVRAGLPPRPASSWRSAGPWGPVVATSHARVAGPYVEISALGPDVGRQDEVAPVVPADHDRLFPLVADDADRGWCQGEKAAVFRWQA